MSVYKPWFNDETAETCVTLDFRLRCTLYKGNFVAIQRAQLSHDSKKKVARIPSFVNDARLLWIKLLVSNALV